MSDEYCMGCRWRQDKCKCHHPVAVAVSDAGFCVASAHQAQGPDLPPVEGYLTDDERAERIMAHVKELFARIAEGSPTRSHRAARSLRAQATEPPPVLSCAACNALPGKSCWRHR